MTVENTSTIDGLNITLPAATDRLIEGDDHLRQLKIVEKTIFSGVNGDGFNTPILATESDLNNLQGLIDDIETQLQTLRNGETPIGGIQFYNGLLSAIPSRFFLCDGLNGTPDMSNMFIYGSGTEAALNNTGGSADDVVVTHTHSSTHNHPGTSSNDAGHTHLTPLAGSQFVNQGQSSRSTNLDNTVFGNAKNAGAHTHLGESNVDAITTAQAGVLPIGTNLPRYYKAAYIMRVS